MNWNGNNNFIHGSKVKFWLWLFNDKHKRCIKTISVNMYCIQYLKCFQTILISWTSPVKRASGKHFNCEGDLLQDIVGRGLNKLYGLWDELGIDENGRKVNILIIISDFNHWSGIRKYSCGFGDILYRSGYADLENRITDPDQRGQFITDPVGFGWGSGSYLPVEKITFSIPYVT